VAPGNEAAVDAFAIDDVADVALRPAGEASRKYTTRPAPAAARFLVSARSRIPLSFLGRRQAGAMHRRMMG
jgi:hypothetical protein